MSRAAIYQAIVNDSQLNDMNITGDTVFPNYTKDEVPVRGLPFVILRWQERPMRGPLLGPQIVTIWAHQPAEDSTDYQPVDDILYRIRDVLVALEQVDGGDGFTVTEVRFTGFGGDLKDNGYNTITKNSAFEVLFHPTA